VRSPVAELLARVDRATKEISARWYLFGAQAALLYGAARLTADVDVTVDLGEHMPEELATAMERAGFQLRFSDRDFIRRTRVLPASDPATGLGLDVVLAGPGIEELFFARVEHRDIDGVDVPVASADDLVAMKILAGRPKDLDDVAAILAARAEDFDERRLRETLELLEQALDRRDLLPELERALRKTRHA
jgi:hypothetical protein